MSDAETLRLRVKRQRDKLIDIIDSESGLLNILLQFDDFSEREIERIGLMPSSYEKNEMLLNYVARTDKPERLIAALSESLQTHVVNWIIADGEYRNEFGFDWPLTDKENRILRVNQATLVEILSPCELLYKLYSREVINARQRDFIKSKPTDHDKNEALLRIIRRMSLQSFHKLLVCLRDTKQEHVAHTLEFGGAIVPVHATLEADNLDETETQLVTKLHDLLCSNTTTMEQENRVLAALGLKVIAVRRGKSIVLYVKCCTEEEFNHLCKVVDYMEMKETLQKLFNLFLPSLKTKVMAVTIFERDIAEAKKSFAQKQRNRRIRDGVMDMYRQFVSEVDPKNVLDLLIEKRVISIEQKQKFMIKVTRKERCRALLDHLLYSSNDESFIVLRDALEDQYPWIVELIDQCETDNEITRIPDAKFDQNKITQTENQEQSEDPIHVNLPFDMGERLKKEFDAAKSKLEIENRHLEQKLEESRQENKTLAHALQESTKEGKTFEQKLEESKTGSKKLEQELQESRNEIAEMKDQYRILKETLDKALDREGNLKKELYSIKSQEKLGIFGYLRKALDTTLKSSEPQQSHTTPSLDMNISVYEKSRRKLSGLSSCCICSITMEENRMTPCFHVACLKCLEDIQTKSNKKPGDVLPCPSCGKAFAIPSEGMKGLQKNLFAKSPTDIERLFDLENKSKTCKTHSEKVLDFYCKDCDTVACVSCFVEDHKFHDCKDVTTIDKDFRRRLEETTKILSRQRQEMLSRRLDMERLMTEFLARSLETSEEIKKKSDTLKSFIDHHAGILLGELSTIEQRHQANMEREIDEIEKDTEVLDSFVTYCTQMIVKGSASDVCCCACNLIEKAEKLSKENEEYLLSPSKLVGIEFIATNPDETVHVGANVIGKLSESSKLSESKVFVFGINDGVSIAHDIIKINLNRSEDVSKAGHTPVVMSGVSAAAVLCDSIFVTGIGKTCDEIWRFNATSSIWKKCASLVQYRQCHCIAFVDQVLYICGGRVHYDKKTLDDVEAYDTHKDQCVSVGKLDFAFYGFSNCVPFKSSLYIFGGRDANGEITNKVQVYDTKFNTCTLLSEPMPGAQCVLRAVLWENTVILLGYDCCLTHNFETQLWEVRDHFKTDVYHFGLVISNGLLFVIGGGDRKVDADGKTKWICGDDVRCIPLVNILKNEPIDWKHHATLPKPSLVYAFGKMDSGLK